MPGDSGPKGDPGDVGPSGPRGDPGPPGAPVSKTKHTCMRFSLHEMKYLENLSLKVF